MVKKSLQEIARAINGDSKADAAPLFKVNVMLDDNRVSLQPSTQALSQMVNKVAQELITVIKVVPRVTDTTQRPPPPPTPRARVKAEGNLTLPAFAHETQIQKKNKYGNNKTVRK